MLLCVFDFVFCVCVWVFGDCVVYVVVVFVVCVECGEVVVMDFEGFVGEWWMLG